MRTVLFALLSVSFLIGIAYSSEPCTDSIYANAVQDTVNVFHDGAFYNCCGVIEFDFEIGDTTIDVVETETFPKGPCYCDCCFDLRVSIGGVPAGVYWVQVWNADKSVLYGKVRVVVGAAPSGLPEISEFWQSDCYTVVPGKEREAPPITFLLNDPVPNPTEGQTRFFYQLEKQESVSIEIYDYSGRAVTELARGEQPAGRYTLLWDGGSLPSGVYFLRLSAGQSAAVRKLVIAR